MRKEKKPAKPGKRSDSPAISKTRFEAHLDPDLIDQLRDLDKTHRKEIGDLLNAVCDSFGAPHRHQGLGLRDLGNGFYECRHGLRRRIVFERIPGGLYFYIMGDHKEVAQFLARFR